MRPTWSQHLSARPCGLSLAREKASLLCWDQTHYLYLLNRTGQRRAMRHLGADLASACVSDDGSACVAVSTSGNLLWLSPDLTVRWQVSVSATPLAVAVDPFGRYVAVADEHSKVHLFDRLGERVLTITCPRPVHHLAFVPEQPLLVACAEYGFVGAFDLSGRGIWRDGLVAHVGALAIIGEGSQVVLACFTEGLHRYGADGRRLDRLPLEETCRLVAVSFKGQHLLVGGMSKRLLLLDIAGKALDTHQLEQPAIAIALSPLADYAMVALADGLVLCGEW
jgi:hypothetical protein